MRLADFIRLNSEAILVEWEAFASTCVPVNKYSSLELRNHGGQILEAIAKDISNPQSGYEQAQKSKGLAPEIAGAPETAAQTNAILRGKIGFDINQLVSEYRALRASVLRLWNRANLGQPSHLDDMIRFNEAMDQALSESVTFYSAQVEHSRTLLLAMIGHDMRSPLQTMQFAAGYLTRANASGENAVVAQRFAASAERMTALLDDLVDFNRSRLGLGLRVKPDQVDLAVAFSQEVDRLRYTNPGHPIEFDVAGDVTGVWDERRLQQVLCNLVTNAVKFGSRTVPISVRLIGVKDCVTLEVENAGALDASGGVEHLFEPLRQGASARKQHAPDSIGLGLYIAREIAFAHGGEISVRAQPEATVFAVRLPRIPASVAALLATPA